MNGTYLLVIIALIWFVIIMWEDIFKLLKFIFEPLLKLKAGCRWFLNLESDRRNIGIFILTAISGLGLWAYFHYRSKGAIDKDTIPDALLVILVSAPVAWGLWNWRNKDKHIDLKHEERKLINDELIANTNTFLILTDRIINEKTDITTKIAAVQALEPFVNGSRGKDFAEQSYQFILFHFYRIQHEHYSEDRENRPKEAYHRAYLHLFNSRLFSDSSLDIRSIILGDAFCLDRKIIIHINTCAFVKYRFCNVIFCKCRISQTLFQSGYFMDCCFNECEFDFCHFNNTKFLNTKFIKCTFKDSIIEKTKFHGCTFDECINNGSNLKNMDPNYFSDNEQSSIDFISSIGPFNDKIEIYFEHFIPNFKYILEKTLETKNRNEKLVICRKHY